MWFPVGDSLVPAWYTELLVGESESRASRHVAHVVSASDGALLLRKDLAAHATFQYRVWAEATAPFTPFDGPHGNGATPHPTGAPDGWRAPYVAPNLVSLQNAPFSQNDPWLAAGATETTGNNVDAYADIAGADGFTAGDVRATLTGPGTFDRVYDTALAPNASNAQIQAAVTHLFFVNNWLHDWFYDSGFREADGNAQTDNFGRGGLGGDPLLAEGQDRSGTDNANMSTPADGESPRMQMFVFQGSADAKLTATVAGTVPEEYGATESTGFGAQTFDLSGTLALPTGLGRGLRPLPGRARGAHRAHPARHLLVRREGAAGPECRRVGHRHLQQCARVLRDRRDRERHHHPCARHQRNRGSGPRRGPGDARP